MKRIIVFFYGAASYVFFLSVFLYAIGFVGNILVPRSIDGVMLDPIGKAILINAFILGLFAIQHTIMARPAFKAIIGKIIPQAAERSTFVLATNIIFVIIFWQWRPMGGNIWSIESMGWAYVLHAFFWLGWGIVLFSTFLIDHFELFGLKQVIRYLQKKEAKPPQFKERSLYKIVRHPIMLGFVIAFWSTPTMGVGRFFFAALCTGYIMVGLTFEERDLVKHHDEIYLQYARRVPMLIPFLKFNQSGGGSKSELEKETA